ncbi:MAG: hypothetical protein LBG58_03525 [Planctomycetaceae bacterium]|jgi:hypothetical protein|nr:hypothetical protein [Planctomycetaceae bacterium]
MGAFFDSAHIRYTNIDQIIQLLNDNPLLIGSYYIVHPNNGWISLYLEVCDQEIYETLSFQLQTLIFAIKIYEDSIFYYFCYDNGRFIDGYESQVDLVATVSDDKKKFMVGDTSKWIDKLPCVVNKNMVDNILYSLSNSGLMLGNYPDEFCDLIHLPNALLSYDHIYENDKELLLSVNNLDSFIHCYHPVHFKKCTCPICIKKTYNSNIIF